MSKDSYSLFKIKEPRFKEGDIKANNIIKINIGIPKPTRTLQVDENGKVTYIEIK